MLDGETVMPGRPRPKSSGSGLTRVLPDLTAARAFAAASHDPGSLRGNLPSLKLHQAVTIRDS
ncbi:MAG: hypothetical protein OER87_17745, partial [Gammaproteobacteria bacterium]|nr:hypothetical protein [Gammaproteobacteria bacterium]